MVNILIWDLGFGPLAWALGILGPTFGYGPLAWALGILGPTFAYGPIAWALGTLGLLKNVDAYKCIDFFAKNADVWRNMSNIWRTLTNIWRSLENIWRTFGKILRTFGEIWLGCLACFALARLSWSCLAVCLALPCLGRQQAS